VTVGVGPTFTRSPLQPGFADAGILVLLYTVAASRTLLAAKAAVN